MPAPPKTSGIRKTETRSAWGGPGGREAVRAQAIVDGDERLDILGEMNGRAVRFSGIDRRSIRTARRIHQDGCAVVADQTRIGARRGVAGHALARCIQEARLSE